MWCCSTATCRNVDGFSVAERIRATPGLRDSTILMLTSADRTSDMRRCRELGLAAYIVKPVTQKELRNTVVKALSGRPAFASPWREVLERTSDRPLRILLAEDNVVNQKVAMSLLSRLGHDVTMAADGQAGIDLYRRQPFDLILMDVQMPILSGYDATRAIRQIERTTGTHIPIVAMTARAMTGDRERCLDAGMDDYMSKPIQRKQIIDVIRRTSAPGAGARAEAARLPIDDVIALELVGGDEAALRQVKDLCISETPRLLDEIERALSDDRADAVSAASQALRGSYLVFGPNEVATLAEHLEELAIAGDLAGAAVAFADLRSAADRLVAALRSIEPPVAHPLP